MSVSLARSNASAGMQDFASEVGAEGPVRVIGGRTQWNRGRTTTPAGQTSDISIREVRAPTGAISVEPAELIVRVDAGTLWGDLDRTLESAGMLCPLDAPDETSTVGGVLSVGESGFRRLRYGHIRDLLLEARYVNSAGLIVKAGAPVVKNVTGFDLCRLLVGSIGTLGLIGEVVLRCRPRPQQQLWFESATANPFDVRDRLYQPSFIGWTGDKTCVCIEGSSVEISAERTSLGTTAVDWAECGPYTIPLGRRISLRPSDLRRAREEFAGQMWLAEIGVGVVHLGGTALPEAKPALSASVQQLNLDLKRAYDPSGRFNPGVQP